MARSARCIWPGVAYHITQRGTDRQKVFLSHSDCGFYTGLLRDQLADCAVRLLGYCCMPNHVHLIAVPEQADSLAVLLRRVHGRYAQYLNVKKQRSGHLWQNRYFSCPLSERHLWTALRYVEYNPVRAALAAQPQDHRWSSAQAHLTGSDPDGLLDLRFWQDAGGAERWRALLAEPEDLVALRLLRRCTYAGRPFGEQAFVASMEERFQRQWRRWSWEATLFPQPLSRLDPRPTKGTHQSATFEV